MDTIDDVLSALPRLHRDQLMVLAAAHRRDDPAREAAWASALAVIADAGLGREMDRLRSVVIGWATRPASTPTQWAEIPIANGLLDQDARRAAGPAILDAAVAALLGERLKPADRDALLQPWRNLSAEPRSPSREPRSGHRPMG